MKITKLRIRYSVTIEVDCNIELPDDSFLSPKHQKGVNDYVDNLDPLSLVGFPDGEVVGYQNSEEEYFTDCT